MLPKISRFYDGYMLLDSSRYLSLFVSTYVIILFIVCIWYILFYGMICDVSVIFAFEKCDLNVVVFHFMN